MIDDNNNKKIEFEEFYKVLNDYKIELPLVQIQKLFAYFDKDRSGTIDYDELLVGIRVYLEILNPSNFESRESLILLEKLWLLKLSLNSIKMAMVKSH